MKSTKSSYHNLLALVDGTKINEHHRHLAGEGSERTSGLHRSSTDYSAPRLIIVSNYLPLRAKKTESGSYTFEWDEDALVAQAKEGVPPDYDVKYVGCLQVEIDHSEQEAVAELLKQDFRCCPVFLDADLKAKFYRGCCKNQLWSLFHYVLPMSPHSLGRFDPEAWQAYVKANKVFAETVVEESGSDSDYVWIHDYHLLVLPSLLRKRFNRIRCGVFLHSPFPSSEIFRTFPRREELLRSMLNADLIGFHTFDYARHFLSCCSRMLGLEHETSRGSITLEYYGRTVGIKIMPTGVNPQRYLDGFSWPEFQWRRGELLSAFEGKTVLVGCDDMDTFKGIELKLQAYDRLLDNHKEYRGKLVLVQITNPPRSSSHDISELHSFIKDLVAAINRRWGSASYTPVQMLEYAVPLHERMAFFSVADCVVVTATRDGMNLVPYEYVVCRQGPDADKLSARASMLIVSEFVGCSPSLSGAIRVNPWSLESVSDGMHAAIRMPLTQRRLRHDKHWRYVSQHTVAYWASSYMADFVRVTKSHPGMQCYSLGLGLDTFRMVALDANFRKLEDSVVCAAYASSQSRVLFLDYDGTLTAAQQLSADLGLAPGEEVLDLLRALTDAPGNHVCLLSGRTQADLNKWFDGMPNLSLVAENGYFFKACGSSSWETLNPHADFSWKKMTHPILSQYAESTDGSFVEVKESALVWNYKDADPDFGSWQAKELLDHLEGVLSNKPVEIVGASGSGMVEVKPRGISKGQAVERLMGSIQADFVLCIGDDRSDEDMFVAIESLKAQPETPAQVFACTVGQKPSRAPFYLNEPQEVLALLQRLVHRQ